MILNVEGYFIAHAAARSSYFAGIWDLFGV
jgi:hypothetical protein